MWRGVILLLGCSANQGWLLVQSILHLSIVILNTVTMIQKLLQNLYNFPLDFYNVTNSTPCWQGAEMAFATMIQSLLQVLYNLSLDFYKVTNPTNFWRGALHRWPLLQCDNPCYKFYINYHWIFYNVTNPTNFWQGA